MMLDRRSLLGAAGALALTPFVPAFARSPQVMPETVDLAVSTTRSTRLVIWRPAKAKGVVLFSTGHGSWPERYSLLVDLLVADGFAVFAPVHVDSVHYPERDKFSLQASFPERLADMAATAAVAAEALPGLPVMAVGHSFGSLIALCLGGAVAYFGKFRNPAVRAVLGFSSPGKIPGLIQPSAYATLAVPAMIVTGTKDVVPTFAENPADHLFPIESSPAGGKFALVVAGADHGLVADPASFTRAKTAVGDFVTGYGLDVAAARNRLAHFKAAPGDRFIVRDVAA